MQASHEDFSVAVSKLHAAMAAVANGDTAKIKALYAHSAEATSFSKS
jgi:hypothetical protein